MKLRRITKRDAPEIRRILSATPEFDKHDIAYCMEFVKDLDDPYSAYVFACAEDKGRIIGFICFDVNELSSGLIELCWIVVPKELRGRGIARKLHSYMEDYATKKRMRMIVTETESIPPYKSARDFYEHAGYSKAAVVKDFYADGNDKIIYCKRVRK